MVGLDGRRRALERDRLDHVGIERALGEPRDVPELAGLVLEDRDELGADGLALDLRIRDAFQTIKESLGCIDMYQVHLEGIAEGPHHAVGLSFAEQAVVHEEAREPVAHRLVDQRGHHGGVHAARERAEHRVLAHLSADALHGRVHERGHGPVGGGARRVEEVLEHGLALGGMGHLGVELDREEPPGRIGHGRDRAVVGGGQAREARRRLQHGVPVAHPHGHETVGLRLHAAQQSLAAQDPELRLAVLATLGRDDVAAHEEAHRLHAVADAEQRQAGLEQTLVGQRGLVLVHARRPAREHDAGVAARQHAIHRIGARQDLGIHAQLADAPGDELRVLAAEIEDRDLAGRGSPGHHRDATWASPASGRAGRPCPRS